MDKRGIIWFLAIPLIILGIILIGVAVVYFEKALDFFKSTPFLIGVGVILSLIFFKFVSAFLINVVLPLIMMVVRAIQRIFNVLIGAL